MNKTHTISAGIMSNKQLAITLNSPYTNGTTTLSGQLVAEIKGNTIQISTANGETLENNTFLFTATDGNFSVEGVTIGVDFHWESKEQQTFQGNLKLIIEDHKIRLINVLDIEDYLCSNISSEMSATSSMALLKAHTIMSRSWLLAQLNKSKQDSTTYNSCTETPDERIKWYDREDHTLFDVCADDHCQRYQGITRIVSPLVRKAVEETRGQILMYNNQICDARYYKCCGGITEQFNTCWEPIHYNYLSGIIDSHEEQKNVKYDFSSEDNARAWITANPPAHCNVEDSTILKQVLNDYDQATPDFYRWKVEYTQDQLSQLIAERSGIDLGSIITITPLSRGTSARIDRLKIEGNKKSFTFGKELEIRKTLSPSHLYSSAFVVDYGKAIDGIPQSFTLTGAGWGHGVGLCQIGAAVMADKGASHQEILAHYFQGAEIKRN